MPTLLSPSMAADLFLTPDRAADKGNVQSETKPRITFSSPSGKITAWSEGEGPAVLMVHGWSGRYSDMEAFVAPLVAAGYKVVSIDLPAHGESEGTTASIPDMAIAIHAVAVAIGPLHGVVSHSVGCAATAVAFERGMKATRTVFVAPPARYAHFARAFSRQAGLDADTLLDALRSRNIDVDSIDLPLMAPKFSAAALIIHSHDDQIVPFANGQAIAAAWPGARLFECSGLGHKRILSDSKVVNEAVSFLT